MCDSCRRRVEELSRERDVLAERWQCPACGGCFFVRDGRWLDWPVLVYLACALAVTLLVAVAR